MLARQEGLTDTYNRFHDPTETSDDIQHLRELHVEMDEAVAVAYGWDDLDLGHGYHETAQGIRFTINEVARREVLTRLLKLNHERYREELLQGLHKPKDVKAWLADHPEDAQFLSAGKVPMKKQPKKSPSKKQSSNTIKGSIKPFGSDDSPTQISMFDGDE